MSRIDEIKRRVGIVDCLRHFGVDVPAKESKLIRIMCPFHQEKHPSFVIYTRNNTCRCYGCGKGGDVLDVTELFLDVDLKGAIKYWQDLLGINGLGDRREHTKDAGYVQRLRDYAKIYSRMVEREPLIPGVPNIALARGKYTGEYMCWIYSEKDEVDAKGSNAVTVEEILGYIGELASWRMWAEGIIKPIWARVRDSVLLTGIFGN